MVFQAEYGNDGLKKQRDQSIFEDVLDDSEAISGGENDYSIARYRISLKKPAQIDLTVDYLSVGASFPMTFEIVMIMTERTGLASLGSAQVGNTTSYVLFFILSHPSITTESDQLDLEILGGDGRVNRCGLATSFIYI